MVVSAFKYGSLDVNMHSEIYMLGYRSAGGAHGTRTRRHLVENGNFFLNTQEFLSFQLFNRTDVFLQNFIGYN